MAQFDRQIATAIRLIKKYGQVIAWRQTLNEDDIVEPWKEEAPDEVTPDKTPSIVFLYSDNKAEETLGFMVGSDIPNGTLIGYMGSVDFTPSISDIVIRDSEVLRIKNINVLSPNGQIILYIIEFAK